ncbi:MAG TPA: hypothetical protein PLK90_00425 [Clostridiales bacterium]|nr:hypothetical protein [Clostridiales bacterium]HQP68843.1 hypothetical protein [Clostridiales bacterium]
MRKNVVYELTDEDVQNVSEEVLGRKLNSSEILKIKDVIAEKIDWFDAIESSINETILENK